ncbi:uncharacterized protein F5147DRAFT_673898 [Suillus discolor]|uniref:Uncharacterized protein n=1 Tax=Suillus discolor TaxID=1912936 RepID=A0A9P7FF91_9AGAM|nr:uncharacterized protein F5147DRAFT_673898 [Suillus discolor]KAG2116672.1 hypothetical protein F5147DRAFT_673898 [Suillus discolor]
MRFFAHLSVLLSFVLSWCSVSASSAHQLHRRHHDGKRLNSALAVREPGDVDMYKRDFPNSRFTFYAVGLGACGQVNQASDMVVAMNTQQFSGSCFQMITITCNGVTLQAQVVDECMGCPYGGLDFSVGLFEGFSPLSAGVISGTWSFNSASAPAPSPSTSAYQPPPAPTTSSQPKATPTPTPPPPPSTSATSSPSPTPSSSSITSSSISSSTSNTFISSSPSASSSASSTTSADSVVETAGSVPASVGDSSALMNLNLAMVYLGGLLNGAQT